MAQGQGCLLWELVLMWLVLLPLPRGKFTSLPKCEKEGFQTSHCNILEGTKHSGLHSRPDSRSLSPKAL